MANSEETPANKPRLKRRLKQAPTIREQAEQQAKKQEKKLQASDKQHVGKAFVSGFFAPLRFVGKILKKISRFVVPPYFRNSWRELRQVSWPSLRDSRRMTTAVIVFSILFGALVAVLDFGLGELFKRILV